MPEFYTQKSVKGRKDYRCCECGETIPMRTEHECVSGKWEGSMDTYRTCLACVALRNRIADGDCFCFTGLSDELSYGDHDECEDVKAFRKRCDASDERYDSRGCGV